MHSDPAPRIYRSIPTPLIANFVDAFRTIHMSAKAQAVVFKMLKFELDGRLTAKGVEEDPFLRDDFCSETMCSLKDKFTSGRISFYRQNPVQKRMHQESVQSPSSKGMKEKRGQEDLRHKYGKDVHLRVSCEMPSRHSSIKSVCRESRIFSGLFDRVAKKVGLVLSRQVDAV
ncbi:hypothetical protein BG015_005187 [Linnemannia schmuckeri]|uniref:Uncharacterized protein n=1 Tax=Linnemannia schmuckeri TaxID=64567 RepID=A0A9P5S4P4_9FUNG|nr:hypothetical protein BG015_005187 [Linnemannia schmuckeri]